MTGKERLQAVLQHQSPGPVPLAVGALHVRTIAALRQHHGLPHRLAKVIEPAQLLGQLDDDLLDALGVAVVGLYPPVSTFGYRQEGWHLFHLPFGQDVSVPRDFRVSYDPNGDLLIYPGGDLRAEPCARLGADSPTAFVRLHDAPYPGEVGAAASGPLSDTDLAHYAALAQAIAAGGRAALFTLPRGWTAHAPLVIAQLAQLHAVVGAAIDLIDLGSTHAADAAVCRALLAPAWHVLNDWVHQHTPWKTLLHVGTAGADYLPQGHAAGCDVVSLAAPELARVDAAALPGALVLWGSDCSAAAWPALAATGRCICGPTPDTGPLDADAVLALAATRRQPWLEQAPPSPGTAAG